MLTVPVSLKDLVTVNDDGSTLAIRCQGSASLNEHELSAFLTQVLAQEIKDPKELFIFGSQHEPILLLVDETMGNLVHHSYPEVAEQSSMNLQIDRKSGAITVSSHGYVSEQSRKRMGIKFQAAQSLTPEQALARVERYENTQNDEHDGIVSPNGTHTGGLGLLAQRALAEGPMQLTFYPDRCLNGQNSNGESLPLQQFELTVCARLGHGQSMNDPSRSFFPHVVKGRR